MTSDFGADLAALIRAYEAGGHSVFRPSSASRWTRCAGSVLAEIQAQADSAGYAAAEGTVAHEIAEHQLRNRGKRPKWAKIGNYRAMRGFQIEITAEMLSYVEQYVEWCFDLGPGDMVECERRVDFSDLTPLPNQGGTADHIHIKNGVLTITDLKYGVAVRVYATDNDQARLYAYGAWREWSWAYHIHTIIIRICQPRLDVFETWAIGIDQLGRFADHVRTAAHKAWQPNAPRTPDPKACRFCSVQATCPAQVKMAEAVADMMLDDLDGLEVDPETVSVPDGVLAPRREPDKLSNEELAIVLRWRGTFDAWFRSVHDELLRRATAGQPAPGWEIEEGTTKRQWRDEEVAAELLIGLGLTEDQIFEKRIISPKRASDLLRVKKLKPELLLKDNIEKPRGRLSLVASGRGVLGDKSAEDAMLDDLD